MANLVEIVTTDGYRSVLAQTYQILAGNPSVWAGLAYFKVGEGGWSNTPDGHQPVTPNPALTDITASSYPINSNFVYQKNFLQTDLVYVPTRKLRMRCFLDLSEANLNNVGNPPSFFEIGAFDANNVMIVYQTFPMEVKTGDKALEHFLTIDY